MRRRSEYYCVLFFLNGELEDLQLYDKESDAVSDAGLWCSTSKETGHPYTRVEESPFRGTVLYQMQVARGPVWDQLKIRCGTLEDTIVQWLHENPRNVWSNVIASITSSSLSDVYEALLRARKSRRIIITDTVGTSLGPICEVRLPWVDDRIIWALLDAPDALWSDEIASASGDALPDVKTELEELRKIDVVEILEARQGAAGQLLRVRLHPDERHRLLNAE